MARRDIDDPDLERELERLLEELRVALPGVQILFAFLLTVAFTNRFADVDSVELRTYFVALVCTFFSSIFFIAPTSYHRLRFRQHDDPEVMVRNANVFAIVGLAWLALALTAVMFLVTHFIFERTAAIVVTAVAFAAVTALWYGVPVRRYLQRG